MRWMLILVLISSFGCAGMTANKCKNYTTLAKVIAVQLAEDIDPASAEGKELRDRWAAVGELMAKAGCEQWAEGEVVE